MYGQSLHFYSPIYWNVTGQATKTRARYNSTIFFNLHWQHYHPLAVLPFYTPHS